MHMHVSNKLVSVSQSRRDSLCILSRRLPVSRCLLESRTSFRQLWAPSRHSMTHLAWCDMSGSSSFRRAISVCMNLLYAVSFLRPPPPEDLAAPYVSQVMFVGDDCAPFLSGFSLAAFFSLGIDGQWTAYGWSIK